MERCRVGRRRTGRTFVLVCFNLKVLLVFDTVWAWGCNLNLMYCPNTLQWRWRMCVYLRCLNVWNGVVLVACVRTGSTFVLGCAFIWNCYLLTVSWSHNKLTLMCRPNTLQWRCRMCVYLHRMYGTISCWACMDRKYVCIGVLSVEFEVVIGVRHSTYEVVKSISPSCVVQIHYNNGDDGWNLSSLNVWNGVVLVANEQAVRLYWCVLGFTAFIGVWCMQY